MGETNFNLEDEHVAFQATVTEQCYGNHAAWYRFDRSAAVRHMYYNQRIDDAWLGWCMARGITLDQIGRGTKKGNVL